MACNKSFTMEEKRRLMELCKDGAAKKENGICPEDRLRMRNSLPV